MKNLDRLEIGKAYTHQELCAIFEEKVASNRKKQRDRWYKAVEFKYEKPLYYILNIREVPFPDGRSKGNNSKYIDTFKDVIMYSLKQAEEIEYKTQQDWLLRFGVVSKNLYDPYTEIAKTYSHLIRDHTGFYARECQKEVRNFINPKFNDAIESLDKTGHLNHIKTYVIYDTAGSRIATTEEAKKISLVEQAEMDVLGVKSFYNANSKGVYAKLIKNINEKLNEAYGYEKVYKVTGPKKTLKEYSYNFENRVNARAELNKSLYDGLKVHFINKGENGREKVDELKGSILEKWFDGEDITGFKSPFQYEEDYEDAMLSLVDIFLSL